MTYDIEMIWDEEACVWCAVCDDIPIALESSSYDTLIDRVVMATPELLELNGKSTDSVILRFISNRFASIA